MNLKTLLLSICVVFHGSAAFATSDWTQHLDKGIRFQFAGKFLEAEKEGLLALNDIKTLRLKGTLEEGSVFQFLGSLNDEKGNYKQAEKYYQQSLKISEKKAGLLASESISNRNVLIKLYQLNGRPNEAETLLKQALSLEHNVNHTDTIQTTRCLIQLAAFYNTQHRYDLAEKYYLQALSIAELRTDCFPVELAGCMTNLAVFYEARKDYVRAERYYKKRLSIFEDYGSSRDPELQIPFSLNLLGEFYCRRAQYVSAKPVLDRALAITGQACGPNDIRVAEALKSCAAVLRHLGKISESATLEQRANTIIRAQIP